MRTRMTVLIVALTLAATVASAETVSFSFSGIADTVDPPLAGTFEIGDVLSGTFEFDPLATIGSCKFIFFPCYSSPVQPLLATLGSYAFSGNVSVALLDFNNDQWVALATSPTGIAETNIVGPSVNGLPIFVFRLSLTDPSGAALDSRALAPPVFGDYSERRFELEFGPGTGDIEVEGTLTSLAPTAVPEPATVLLLLAGVSAAGTRWKRR